MPQAGALVGIPHLPGFAGVGADGLFAEDVFALFGARDHRFVVQCIWGEHHHKIDIRMVHDFPPVVSDQLGAVFLGSCLQSVLAACAQRDDACIVAGFSDFLAVRGADEPRGSDDSYLKLHGQPHC